MSFIRGRVNGVSPLWVSKMASGGSYTIGECGTIEYDLSGNSYHVLEVNNAGLRVAIVKRDPDGDVIWQRVSDPFVGGGSYFFDMKNLSNGNLIIYHARVGLADSRQRLFMFSSGGTLLRSRTLTMDVWPWGSRIRSDELSAQIWGGDQGILGASVSNPLLLTVSIADNSTFGDLISFYNYDISGTNGYCRDVRQLSNGNLIMVATYSDGGSVTDCLELATDGSSLVRNARFTVGGGAQDFRHALPYSDGSVVLISTNRALKINNLFNEVWHRNVTLPGDGPMYPIMDSFENMCYASRSGAGADGADLTGFVGDPGCNVQKVSSDFTSVYYATAGNNGMGSSAYAYLGTNSGFDLANGRFIGCSGNGNNVACHNTVIPLTNLPLSGGQTASFKSSYAITAPTDVISPTITRSVPSVTIASITPSYISETWSFSDPGVNLSWDLFRV